MKIRIAAIITAAALLLCGCSAGSGKNGADTGEAGNEVPGFTPAGEFREGKANVYLIVKSINNNYFKVMFDAAKDAAAELECNVYYSGAVTSSDWKAQEELMDIAVQNGADAVILAPNDSVRLVDKAQELYNKGIAVICVDAVINSSSYNVCYMTDNLFAGRQAAFELTENLKKCGYSEDESLRIAIQTGRKMSQTISERVAGFCSYWTENAPAKWEIISDIKSNEGDDSKAFSIAEEFFAEYGDIKGVFGTNNGTTRGFAEYLSANGRTDVAIVGFDYSDAIAGLINDSSYNASVMLQRQYDMAYNAVRSAAEIKDGTFSSEVKLIDTGVLAVNNENINDPDVKTVVERN